LDTALGKMLSEILDLAARMAREDIANAKIVIADEVEKDGLAS